MFKITMRANGVDAAIGADAAEDIEMEFREHRRWHQRVTCSYSEGAIILVAINDFDSDGLALSDEFSDCLSAYLPLGSINDGGIFEIIAVEMI